MKVTKTEIRFKTGFQQPKTGLPKKPVLTSLAKIADDPSLVFSYENSIFTHKSYIFNTLCGRPHEPDPSPSPNWPDPSPLSVWTS